NCLDPSVRYVEEQIYLAGAGITAMDNGVSNKSFFVAGSNILLEQNRHPNTTQNVRVAPHANLYSGPVVIRMMEQNGNTLTGPAVVVDPSWTGMVEIYQPRRANISTLFSGPVDKWLFGSAQEELTGTV